MTADLSELRGERKNMIFTINETGKLEELHYIDIHTGIDCIDDIIGNTGAIGNYIIYNNGDNTYHISQEAFEWWEQYIFYAQEDAEELNFLRMKFDRRDENTGASAIDEIISRFYAPIDMEGEHDAWLEIFKIIREELGGTNEA